MLSVGILTYTFIYSWSNNTYPIILLLECAYPRSMFCVIPLTLAVAIFTFHGKLYVNTCSVGLPAGGVHAMNNVVLTKWRIALSTYNFGVLENH